ncbi:hypothetical protein WJX84_001005 [Apatococcus fuscideae]|uniref:Uncharacterized protein n=1 Tax=Apatococcus fuscideae TaxID=2026836 RepID=A0AAW1TIZ5_9CHLO
MPVRAEESARTSKPQPVVDVFDSEFLALNTEVTLRPSEPQDEALLATGVVPTEFRAYVESDSEPCLLPQRPAPSQPPSCEPSCCSIKYSADESLALADLKISSSGRQLIPLYQLLLNGSRL